ANSRRVSNGPFRSIGNSCSAGLAPDHLDEFRDFLPLLVSVPACNRVLDAMVDMAAEQLLFYLVERGLHRGNLRDDVDAVAVAFDHARQPAHLSFNAAKPLQAVPLRFLIHGTRIPLEGTSYKSGTQRKRGASMTRHIPEDMRQCIEECLRCHAVCLGMASHHCLEAGGAHVEPIHFRLMLACAEACQS